jgi:isoleucyl-tRNA synthetase
MLAPILAFTADEIWENLPPITDRTPFVHMAHLPKANKERDTHLLARWKKLFILRDQVLAKLEEARDRKVIGSSLEARVIIRPSALHEDTTLVKQYANELRFLFIVSEVEIGAQGGHMVLNQVEVERARGMKCERCWNYSTRVGESTRYPTVCERCVTALEEIESQGV